MLKLQYKQKTIKEYLTTYEIADEIESIIKGAPAAWYSRVESFLKQNAFTMAIRGARITLGNGWRIVNE